MKRFLVVRKLSGALFVAATVTVAGATGCSEKPSQSSLPTPKPHGSNTVSNTSSKSILASNKQPFNETDELKARGLRELNSARAADAVKTFNRVLALSPRDALSRSTRGRALARIGKFKQAFVDYDNAIKHDTICADAYLSRTDEVENFPPVPAILLDNEDFKTRTVVEKNLSPRTNEVP